MRLNAMRPDGCGRRVRPAGRVNGADFAGAAICAKFVHTRPAMPNEKVTPTPTEIKLHQKSRVMEITFANGMNFSLPYEFLRVYSPSAEVRGHGAGQEVLQTGKKDIEIQTVEAVGSYAIQPRFSDGHDTGIYSWDYLYELGISHDKRWKDYLGRLAAAGASR